MLREPAVNNISFGKIYRLDDKGNIDYDFSEVTISPIKTETGSYAIFYEFRVIPAGQLFLSGEYSAINFQEAVPPVAIAADGSEFKTFPEGLMRFPKIYSIDSHQNAIYLAGEFHATTDHQAVSLFRTGMGTTSASGTSIPKPSRDFELPVDIFPNPVSGDMLRVSLKEPYPSSLGYQLLTADNRPTPVSGYVEPGAESAQLSLRNLSDGVYFLIFSNKGRSWTQKVIKQE